MEYEIKKFTIKYHQDLKKIYLDSFNKENRYSLIKLLLNLYFKRANIYVLLIKNDISSFLYSIENKNERFILYLAVKENYRNKGIGTYLLKWYLNANNDKEIYLNIDEINKTYDDYIIRKKRLDFYIKNNFYDTNYISINNDLISHILSNKQELNVEKYKLFDKKISQYFLCKSDKITRLS